MITAYISVFDDGKQIDTLYPAKWFFRKHESEPTTEVAIRRTLAEDLYIVLAHRRRSAMQAASCRSSSTRWSTGSGSASASWRSAPASRCCPSARTRSPLADAGRSRGDARWRCCWRSCCSRRHDAVRRSRAWRDSRRRDTQTSSTRAADSRSSCSTRSSAPAACGHVSDRRMPQGSVRHVPRMRGELAALDRPGQERATRSSSAFVDEVRQPGDAGRADRRASTGWRGCSRTWSARAARSWSASRRCAGRAARRPPPRHPAADPALDERLDDELRDLD